MSNISEQSLPCVTMAQGAIPRTASDRNIMHDEEFQNEIHVWVNNSKVKKRKKDDRRMHGSDDCDQLIYTV